LAGTTSKKVVIRRFDREPVTGFVNPRTFLLPEGVEVLTPAGVVSVVPYPEIKVVCFVRDFDDAGPEPEPRLFQARPKAEGLWVRMRFRDNDQMDGLLQNNLLELEAFGFSLVPPNPSANHQRVFVPRSALSEFHVLAVVGSPLRPGKRKPPSKEQLEMFE
jgi:hypothetical protein